MQYAYQIPSGASGTLTDAITVSSARQTQCGGDTATIGVTITVEATPLVTTPTGLSLQGTVGQTVQGTVSISGGATPYTATTSLSGASAAVNSDTVTYSYTIPQGASGTLADIITISDKNGTKAQVPASIRVEDSLSATPAQLSLSGASVVNATNTVSGQFSVSGGKAPYTLTVAKGSGSVTPTQLSAPGTAQYSLAIPANSLATTLAATILVTDASGATTQLPVTVKVGAANALSSRTDLTQNERTVGAAIETLCPQLAAHESSLTPAQRDLLTQCTAMLKNANSAGIPNTLNQVTTEKARASTSAGIEVGNLQLGDIGSRLAALRRGSVALDIQGLTLNVDGQRISGGQLAALTGNRPSGGGASSDSGFGKWGFFLNGSLDFGNKDATTNESGFGFNTEGVTGGVDYRFTDKFVAGVALGYGWNKSDFDSNGGNLTTDSWHLAGYGTYYLSEHVYVDGIVEYGWQSYDSTRNIQYQIAAGLPLLIRQAHASYNGNQLGGSLGTGYDFNRGPLDFGVYGRVNYLKVTVDGFGETGAGGLDLNVNSFDQTSVTTTLGGRVSRAFNTSKAVLVPQASFEWDHEYNNSANNIVAQFAADPFATAFPIFTDTPDKNYFRLGIGLSAVFPRGLSAFLNYSALLGLQNWTGNLIDLGVRWEFY